MDHVIAFVALGMFLLANLVVGLRAGRGIKTMDGYALGDRSIGLGPLIATLFATLFSSGSIDIGSCCKRGFINYIYTPPFVMSIFLLGWFVFPRVTRFKRTYTVAGIMGKVYGGSARVFTVILCTLWSLLMITIQLETLGELSVFFGIERRSVFIMMIGLVISVYTCLGGIRSVTATDVLQFVMIVFSFVLLFLIVMMSMGGVQGVLGGFPEGHDHTKFFWSL